MFLGEVFLLLYRNISGRVVEETEALFMQNGY